MTPRARAAAAFAAALAAAGCKVGPNYGRPSAEVPSAYRGADGPASRPGEPTLGDLGWEHVLTDEVTRELVREAIRDNWDLKVAAERVAQARAYVTVADSGRYPFLFANGSYTSRAVSENGIVPLPAGADRTNAATRLSGDLFWEIDFWGKYARAVEAAEADLFAVEANRLSILQSLVTQVALGHLTLKALDLELEIAKNTLAAREASLRLVTARHSGGVDSMMAVRQAEALVEGAAQIIPQLEQAIAQQENLLSILLGRNPGPIPRGRPLGEQAIPNDVPPGLPSEILERRPDVVLAEQRLVAANARIGVARAALYPTISLTGSAGVESSTLSDLFKSGSTFWSISPNVSLPIFTGGRLSADVRVAEAEQRAALLGYLQTIQGAFRDVADALIATRKTKETRAERARLAATWRDAARLSMMRYDGGVTSYLEVLDTQQQLFDAELGLARAQRDELLAAVTLYKALGGGWQGIALEPQPPPAEDADAARPAESASP